MMFQPIFHKVVRGEHLNEQEAEAMMEAIMEGTATPAQIGGMLTALSIKGETVEEITGCARVMRRKATAVRTGGPVVDTCGTGGDRKNTFNISTTAAIAAAGAGLKIAKHGNRSVSSQCGSADVLEALGIDIQLSAATVEAMLQQTGMGFLFAPVFHQAMKNVVGPRREIAIRTIFNILGPLTNPAGAQSQVVGVFQAELTTVLASVLQRLGTEHALVVHGLDGLDEISVCAPTRITEVKDGSLHTYQITPEDFGFERAEPENLTGGNAAQNASITLAILQGAEGPRRNIVLLNTAAALVAGNRAPDLAAGVKLAANSIDSGKALAKLEELRQFTAGEMQ
ncbi:anthranilate phosphoribosyl transferase [Lucifera butyrica]|uniref:Anthranilate phosphoribosyltransferase n=1 Tax=Lucifera butyrica TaxID=1351585 RepID=A0A498RBY5_9FIRM|nr:anthranilate phosphoribosyltransferase [Lucifera butyrica]VBB06658.1 anthranilate phosphoribosyl transferase [Lucifera butyrica]